MFGHPYGNSQGNVSGASGNCTGWIPEGRIWVFPERWGFRVEGPAGAEELAGAEDIASDVAIASVGVNIKMIIIQ